MTALFGLLGHAIFLMALLLWLFQVRRWKRYWPAVYAVSAIVIILPIQDWLVIEFSRGYFSDLSLATLLVCVLYILNGMRPVAFKIEQSFKIVIIFIGCVLFPSSLGFGQYDLYSLGFPSEPGFNYLVIGSVILGLLAWVMKAQQLSIYLALALSAYALGIYESQNLWVYLIDPIVMLIVLLGYALALVKNTFKFLKSRVHRYV